MSESASSLQVDPTSEPYILVAEDDLAMGDLLQEKLTRLGFRVVVARDGDQALELLNRSLVGEARLPELLITDLRMPGQDGLSLLLLLRAARVSTPVVLLTAFGDVSAHARANSLGASAVFEKPSDLALLLRWTQALLRGS